MSWAEIISMLNAGIFGAMGTIPAGLLSNSSLLSGRAMQMREQDRIREERELMRLRSQMPTGIVPTRMMYDDIIGTEMFRCQFTHQNVPVIRIGDTSVSTW